MEHLRIATSEEIETIKDTSDLTPRSFVLCLGEKKAVVRNVFEVDPLYSGGEAVGPLAKFIWGLEERLIGMGVDAYYFNIAADESSREWRELAEKWGSGCTMPYPSFRYKRVLVR